MPDELDVDAICQKCGHRVASHGPDGCTASSQDLEGRNDACDCQAYTNEGDE